MNEGDLRQTTADRYGCVRHRVAAALRLLAVAAVVTLVAGCGGDASGKNGPGGGPGGGGPGGGGGRGGGGRDGQREQLPTPVETAPVTVGTLRREAEVSGVLEPLRTVGVNAQLPGALLSVRVEEGDHVREGQVLAEVDAREVAAQVRSAEASLALAKATAERQIVLAGYRMAALLHDSMQE